MFSSDDFRFMRIAISLAKKAEGKTSPNPLVGAVIVKDSKIIGQGFHTKYGELHAEREALKNCYELKNDPEGATIYVTLEPCCHFGKQPPCTQALLQAKIKKVVVGSRDPNPLVHGKGNAFLRENGIEVLEDCLKSECDKLNPIFFYYITKKLPFVALKFASTLDGKIATKTGKSKWITNQKSRDFVQTLRNKYSAILCGINTVLADDPLLTCRIENGKNPMRIILDSHLRLPVQSKIVQTAKDVKTIVCCTEKNQKSEEFVKNGVQVLVLKKDENNRVLIEDLLKNLGELKIDSILVEGGSEINFAFLKSGFVNKIYAFFAPKIFGGQAKTSVCGEGISEVSESFNFSLENIQKFDDDVLLEYEKKFNLPE